MWWSINSFSFIKQLFSTPQTNLQCLGKLTAKQGRVIRWICFVTWNWCNIFQWAVFRNNQNFLPCKFIVFEGNFYTYLSPFASTDIKLCCPYYVESCVFIKQIFLGGSLYVTFSVCPSVHPSVTHHLRNRTSFNHNFWYPCVKWW